MAAPLLDLDGAFTPTQTAFGTWLSEADVRLVFPRRGGQMRVRLLASLVWQDPDGDMFVVPRGYVSDGASVPKVLWSLSGGPFDEAYVRAAILHDWQCERRVQTSDQVHERFYRGMRADNVSWLVARSFYRVVLVRGPQWTLSGDTDGN